MAGGMSFHCHRNNLFLTGLKATVLIFMYNLSGVSTERVIVDPHITAILGKKIELMCVVHVQEALTQISWEKVHNGSTQTLAVFNPTYGISIPDEYQDKLSFKTPSENDATLVLEEVSFTDAGEYTCKVVTFPYGNTQASTTVTVMVEPKISVSRGSDPLMDGGNETVVAVCTAENGKPAAEITWVSEVFGEPVQTLIDEPNDCVTVENRYNWKPTRFAQGKQLTCVIRHPALESEIRIPFTLDVLHAPEVAITGYDDNWFVGRENVQLKCNAAANPGATQYSWSRLNGELPAGLRIANNTLIFGRPLDHNDSGTYQCEVTNDIGSRTNTRNIYILDTPSKQTSSVAVAGAVIGAVLALFLIAVFIIVLMTPRKERPSHLDKVIDLPPMNKPPPAYVERAVSTPLTVNTAQLRTTDHRYIFQDYEEQRRHVHEQLSCHEWICQNKGPERVHINHREHYV
ncbi:nectin-3-like protein isoform X2 [Polyodon spathula]|uniref:nectin-3-like protein isoform X2 n=1 Tax=Polyodon spathula TaxID=7913 RepID=UPI001B7DCFD2|nr:nectin-3-like protein isoform X2 [Polyodon spathula]